MVWLFNIYLYFMFVQNPSLYQQLVAGGTSCWVQTSTAHLPLDGPGIAGNLQPGCWYDPSNTNDGRSRTAAMPIIRKRR